MTNQPTDDPIDRLAAARLLAIGLSPTDLAELLDAAFAPNDCNPSAAVDVGRLAQVAKALDMPAMQRNPASQQSLLQLRLLRAFCGLSDLRAQRTLVYLAEQLAKCQASRPKDAP
jgi:hypothetical protein